MTQHKYVSHERNRYRKKSNNQGVYERSEEKPLNIFIRIIFNLNIE